MKATTSRSRWAAIGAAVAVTLGGGGIGVTHAITESGERPIYLPIEPCRLADLRPAPDTVGPRTAPLGPDETYTLAGWGTVGDCTLPTGTAGLALNVTALGATEPTFLAVFPADATEVPNASNLNPVPGQPPTPNAVNVDLDAAGEFSIYNLQGNVNIIIDVVGIYDDHTHDDRYYTEDEVDEALAGKDDVEAAWTRQGIADLSTSDLVVDAVTVETPGPGYLIVNSSGYVTNASDDGIRTRCSITALTSVDSSAYQITSVDTGGYEVLSGTRGFTLNSGLIPSTDEFTVNLVCDTTNGTVDLFDPHLTAIFVPDPDASLVIVAG